MSLAAFLGKGRMRYECMRHALGACVRACVHMCVPRVDPAGAWAKFQTKLVGHPALVAGFAVAMRRAGLAWCPAAQWGGAGRPSRSWRPSRFVGLRLLASHPERLLVEAGSLGKYISRLAERYIEFMG